MFISGLSLELFIEQDEYIPDITEEAGIRVAVHEFDTTAHPHSEGVSITPNALTSLAVRQVYLSHLLYIQILGRPADPMVGNGRADRSLM